MVLIMRGVKVTRIFDGKRFTLEDASKVKSKIYTRKRQLQEVGFNTRIVKSKVHGYLLYST